MTRGRRGEERSATAADLALPVTAQAGVGDAGEVGAQTGVEGGATFGAVEDGALRLAGPEQIHHRAGGVEERPDRRDAAGAHHVVGVLPRRHQGEAQRAAGAEQREREIDQPVRGGEAGRVAVERDDRFRRELPQERELMLGDRGAERGDRVIDAGLRECDDVDVAFGDDDGAGLARGCLRGTVVVEAPALVEERGLGRVQVFRLLPLGDGAGAEGDGAAARIADREHDAAAKPVVGRAGFGEADEADLDETIPAEAVARQVIEQRRAAVGRKADLEPVPGRLGEAATVEIGARLRGAATVELHPVEADGRFHRLV